MRYGPALILRTEEREREGRRKRGEREERKRGGSGWKRRTSPWRLRERFWVVPMPLACTDSV